MLMKLKQRKNKKLTTTDTLFQISKQGQFTIETSNQFG